jgi:hypothetical protein
VGSSERFGFGPVLRNRSRLLSASNQKGAPSEVASAVTSQPIISQPPDRSEATSRSRKRSQALLEQIYLTRQMLAQSTGGG